eukprot:scaffold174224_cov29-Tisochrysis_lutea.AAC.7
MRAPGHLVVGQQLAQSCSPHAYAPPPPREPPQSAHERTIARRCLRQAQRARYGRTRQRTLAGPQGRARDRGAAGSRHPPENPRAPARTPRSRGRARQTQRARPPPRRATSVPSATPASSFY